MIRTGIGFDAHRFAPNRRLVLGGVELPHSEGLQGHSDADALTHAIIDALLGAAADGDIGRHFPDSDPRWKDADSIAMLRATVARLGRQGWRILNIDATIIAEVPTMAPHIPAMRQCLAGALGVETARVSVKASTAEAMGAIGRREGIAVMTVATLKSYEHPQRPKE